MIERAAQRILANHWDGKSLAKRVHWRITGMAPGSVWLGIKADSNGRPRMLYVRAVKPLEQWQDPLAG